MVSVSCSTLIDIFADLIGVSRNPDLDILLSLLVSVLVLFIFDSILRAFIDVFLGGYKR